MKITSQSLRVITVQLLCKMAAGSSQAQASVSSLLNEAIRILTEQQPEQPVPSRSERVAENFR